MHESRFYLILPSATCGEDLLHLRHEVDEGVLRSGQAKECAEGVQRRGGQDGAGAHAAARGEVRHTCNADAAAQLGLQMVAERGAAPDK